MRGLLLAMVVLVSACTHTEERTAPATAFYTKPAPVAVSVQKTACSDSFDHALSNLAGAMKLEGSYAMSQPVVASGRY